MSGFLKATYRIGDGMRWTLLPLAMVSPTLAHAAQPYSMFEAQGDVVRSYIASKKIVRSDPVTYKVVSRVDHRYSSGRRHRYEQIDTVVCGRRGRVISPITGVGVVNINMSESPTHADEPAYDLWKAVCRSR